MRGAGCRKKTLDAVLVDIDDGRGRAHYDALDL